MMFNNVLNGKKGFLDYKNVNLTVKMSIFFYGVTPWFSSKIGHSSESHFLWKRPRHNV